MPLAIATVVLSPNLVAIGCDRGVSVRFSNRTDWHLIVTFALPDGGPGVRDAFDPAAGSAEAYAVPGLYPDEERTADGTRV